MFVPGNILYFNPFYFQNGNTAKRKYFIVLGCKDGASVIASLPTRTANAPSLINDSHGCQNNDARNFCCYVFRKDQVVCDNGFSFPVKTHVYGDQALEYSLQLLRETYRIEGVDYNICGRLTEEEYRDLYECIVSSPATKRKIVRLLKALE